MSLSTLGLQNTVLIVLPIYRLDNDGPQTGLFLYVALNIVVAALMAIALSRREESNST